mmetsp:Transcript_36027/g.93730  ORF Transcript_36027/g.93730 Transcript_36027/m.93730 type:complete len:230 (+) Transcript_36027:180-869(+)
MPPQEGLSWSLSLFHKCPISANLSRRTRRWTSDILLWVAISCSLLHPPCITLAVRPTVLIQLIFDVVSLGLNFVRVSIFNIVFNSSFVVLGVAGIYWCSTKEYQKLVYHGIGVIALSVLLAVVGVFDYYFFSLSPCDPYYNGDPSAVTESGVELCRVPWILIMHSPVLVDLVAGLLTLTFFIILRSEYHMQLVAQQRTEQIETNGEPYALSNNLSATAPDEADSARRVD